MYVQNQMRWIKMIVFSFLLHILWIQHTIGFIQNHIKINLFRKINGKSLVYIISRLRYKWGGSLIERGRAYLKFLIRGRGLLEGGLSREGD